MSELPEYEGEFSATGLKYWRRILGNTSSECVPSSDFNIIDEMDKNLGLKAASLGGHPMVITPVASPPSFKEVWSWCRAKKLYDTMKAEQTTLKTDELMKTENKDQSKSGKSTKETDQSKEISPKFTKLKDQKSVTFDDVTIIDPDSDEGGETPNRKNRITSSPKSSSRVLSKTPAKSAIKKSKAPSPKPEIIDDGDDRDTSGVISPSPPAKRIKTRSSQVNTSTPRRRVPLEKEFPPCTPIQRSGSSLDGVTPSPTTPRSSRTLRSTRRAGGIIPPATPSTSKGRTTPPPFTPTSSRGLKRLSLRLSQRRLSSGMEASLRRLLVASQLKVSVLWIVFSGIKQKSNDHVRQILMLKHFNICIVSFSLCSTSLALSPT